MSAKAQFLSELKALLDKYDVCISAGVGEGSDTHGIYEQTIACSHRVSHPRWEYEDWLVVDGWSLDAGDIGDPQAVTTHQDQANALLTRARNLIAEAMDTHIYNEADGEVPAPDCPYVQFLRDADKFLEVIK